MTIIVFTGPTISEADVLSNVDAICLPPVAQGDVYRAMDFNPTCIGIIDGYFDGVAAVWHKEILWALSQGVHVFGAASMGALRAAELANFGMTGVGVIYDQFRSGELEDDDEVAVIHGPSEIGYPALSEPLVNIRATIALAKREGVLPPTTANELVLAAKSTHYRLRTWDSLVKDIDLPDKFTAWLNDGQIDQKRRDAIAMLQAIKEKVSDGSPKHKPSFDFEWTNQWDRAKTQWDQECKKVTAKDQRVIDELRLRPDAFTVAADAAMLRYALNNQSAAYNNFTIEKADLVEAINAFRKKHNLLSRALLDQWLEKNGLTAGDLESLLAEEVRIKNGGDLASDKFLFCLVNHLKLSGDYARFAKFAKNKNDQLEESGRSGPCLQSTGLPVPALLEWYFCQRRDVAIPTNIDQYAQGLGMNARDDFYQILAREYLYLHDGKGK